jgi:hypothetical protein
MGNIPTLWDKAHNGIPSTNYMLVELCSTATQYYSRGGAGSSLVLALGFGKFRCPFSLEVARAWRFANLLSTDHRAGWCHSTYHSLPGSQYISAWEFLQFIPVYLL